MSATAYFSTIWGFVLALIMACVIAIRYDAKHPRARTDSVCIAVPHGEAVPKAPILPTEET